MPANGKRGRRGRGRRFAQSSSIARELLQTSRTALVELLISARVDGHLRGRLRFLYGRLAGIVQARIACQVSLIYMGAELPSVGSHAIAILGATVAGAYGLLDRLRAQRVRLLAGAS